jgi:DNA-binding transcriptional MerR regulator
MSVVHRAYTPNDLLLLLFIKDLLGLGNQYFWWASNI